MKDKNHPVISIIIPFAGDERGQPAHLASWTKQQEIDPNDFEIIVGHQGENGAVDEIRQELRPRDILFSMPGNTICFTGSEMSIYREGLKRARGEYLLLTEDHVIATPLCLSTILKKLRENPGQDGFSLGCGHINRSHFATAEAAVYDQSLSHWQDPSNWDRVRQRGTLFRRELVEAVGGIPDEYGLFGELVLAMRLWKHGAYIDYFSPVLIRHINLHNFSHFRLEIENFIAGEINYLRKSSISDTFFFGLRDASQLAFLLHHNHLRAIQSALAESRHEIRHRFSSYGNREMAKLNRQLAMRTLLPATFRKLLRMLYAKCLYFGVYFAAGKVELSRDRMKLLWNFLTESSAITYIENLESPFQGISVSSPSRLEDIPTMSMFGLSSLEGGGEIPAFRWASLLSGFYLDLKPGPHKVIIDFAPFRHPASTVSVIPFFDGSPVVNESLYRNDERMTLDVSPSRSGQFLLLLLSDPIKAENDPRSLSLPIKGITIRAC